MTFDKQEHKDLVVALIEQASFPGKMLEVAAELKLAVRVANIAPTQAPFEELKRSIA